MRSESQRQRKNPWHRPWIRQGDLPYIELPDDPNVVLTPEEVQELLPNIARELDGLIAKSLRNPDAFVGAALLADCVDDIAADLMDREHEPALALRLIALHTLASAVIGNVFERSGIGKNTSSFKTPFQDELGIRCALHGAKALQLITCLALTVQNKDSVALVTKAYGVIEAWGQNGSYSTGLLPAVTDPKSLPVSMQNIILSKCAGSMAPVAALKIIKEVLFKGKNVRLFVSQVIPDVIDKIDLFAYAGPKPNQHFPNLAIQIKSRHNIQAPVAISMAANEPIHGKYLAFTDSGHFAFLEVVLKSVTPNDDSAPVPFHIFTGDISRETRQEAIKIRNDDDFLALVRKLLGFGHSRIST